MRVHAVSPFQGLRSGAAFSPRKRGWRSTDLGNQGIVQICTKKVLHEPYTRQELESMGITGLNPYPEGREPSRKGPRAPWTMQKRLSMDNAELRKQTLISMNLAGVVFGNPVSPVGKFPQRAEVVFSSVDDLKNCGIHVFAKVRRTFSKVL